MVLYTVWARLVHVVKRRSHAEAELLGSLSVVILGSWSPFFPATTSMSLPNMGDVLVMTAIESESVLN